jgi:ATP-binding cassette subfamily B (MDR/TAP) protein 1
MTILIIAHRPSTIRGADVIFVIEDGKVAESGRWEDLASNGSGRFHALCVAQRQVA